MLLRTTSLAVVLAAIACAASSNSAAELAKAAKEAQKNGQTVRAYLLYAEAAAEDPGNLSYVANRDALAPAAKLMGDAHLESADISGDIKGAKAKTAEPPTAPGSLVQLTPDEIKQQQDALLPPPKLTIPEGRHDFDINGDDKSVLTRVANAFGVDTLFEPDFEPKPGIRFQLDNADFRTAMTAVTDATGTFVFAISPHRLFVARDTQQNRSEFEPIVVTTVDVPDTVDPKEVTEAANGVRGALGLKGPIGMDTAGHKIILRDRVTQARVAQSILERLMLPKPQVAFHVQLLEVDDVALYHYGIAWQTSFQLLPLGMLSKLRQPIFPTIVNAAATFLPFGGGFGLFGIGLASANLFATFSDAASRVLYDATMRAGDGQAASLHFGEKYPIPTSISAAPVGSTTGGIYSPLGQVTQEDLGLEVKLTPHVQARGNIALDIEAQYETLGTLVLNTVPSINQRQYKGNLILGEGQWAIVGGVIQDQLDVTKSGFPGLSNIKGLEWLLAENTRSNTKSQVLLVIKPQLLTPLPVVDYGNGVQMGPANGDRLIF